MVLLFVVASARTSGAQPDRDRPAPIGDLVLTLKNANYVNRYEAATALENLGVRAEPALPALIDALGDDGSFDGVRWRVQELQERIENGPGRRGDCSPRLPQIRTCPIKASGSSGHGLAAHGGTRLVGCGSRRLFSSRLNASQLNCPRRRRRDSHFRHRRTAS
jgi:hypothetical protein